MTTIAVLAGRLRRGETDAITLATQALDAARLVAAGAFVTVTVDLALEAARRADVELRAGIDRGPLHGIPVAVKDVIDVAGVLTGNGTEGFGHRLPHRDAAAWQALAAAGAVMIGKTRLDELAWGMVTPGCPNPLDPARVSGGSSGGSAAAVAAGVVPLALGTDTGGSIRNPAALCGVTGLRPTHGAIPLSGVSPLAPSQDAIGPLAASAADCQLAFDLMASYGSPGRTPDRAAAPGPQTLPRVLALRTLWTGRVDEAMAAAADQACADLRASGARVADVEIPHAKLAPSASLVVMLAESAQAWRTATAADTRALSANVRAALRCGDSERMVDYMRALDVRRALRSEVDRVLGDQNTVLLLPTVGVGAATAGCATVRISGRDEPIMSAHSRFTALASVTGHPAIACPVGLDHDGMPLSIQLIGPRGGERLLLGVAQVFEGTAGAADVRERRSAAIARATASRQRGL